MSEQSSDWSYAIKSYLFINPFSIIFLHVKAISVSFCESEDMFCEEQKGLEGISVWSLFRGNPTMSLTCDFPHKSCDGHDVVSFRSLKGS